MIFHHAFEYVKPLLNSSESEENKSRTQANVIQLSMTQYFRLSHGFKALQNPLMLSNGMCFPIDLWNSQYFIYIILGITSSFLLQFFQLKRFWKWDIIMHLNMLKLY